MRESQEEGLPMQVEVRRPPASESPSAPEQQAQGLQSPPSVQAAVAPLSLAHGRQLRLTPTGLEIQAPGGGLEVEVLITPEGPVLRLLTPRLAVEGVEDLALRLRSLSVETQTLLKLESGGAAEVSAGLDLDLRAHGELRQNAALIRIN
ncbi:MAG: hypothetical protein ACKO6N_14530 [Myxococcota bacterium]